MKNAIEIEQWCKEQYGEKNIWEKKLPSPTSKEEYENKLWQRLSNIRKKVKRYEGIPIDEIENEEDRKTVISIYLNILPMSAKR